MSVQEETGRQGPGAGRRPTFERRWPVVLTILAVVALLVLLPRTMRLLPLWVTYVLGAVVLAPTVAVELTAARERWLRVERAVMRLFVASSVILLVANLVNLMHAMARKSADVTGPELLRSSVAIWATNMLAFSLMYWQMDRGGPEARVNRAGRRTDWLFPQEGAPAGDVAPGWRPTFIDYLYLAFSTATAFSTADVIPLTARAKLLMMLESMLSLLTIVVVLARAINIFGT
jgi:uncharacterized membrane protein